MLEAVHEPGLTPEVSTACRGVIASVCRERHDRVYTISDFWSTVVVCSNLPMNRLAFIMSMCLTGDVHIRLCLIDVGRVLGGSETMWTIGRLVDDIFARISPSAGRWKSFELSTEDPVVFHCVQFHCRNLRLDSLVIFKLAYVYMPGHSFHPVAVYQMLFEPAYWFNDNFPRLSTLELFCVPLCPQAPGFFDNLQVLELSDFTCSVALDPILLAALFATAPRLRTLRFGPMQSFIVPPNYRLYSCSLRTLDVEFFRPEFVGRLLESIVAPNLTNLALAPIWRYKFTVHSDFGSQISLADLFNSMPKLTELDLTHSYSHVFLAY
ncbi:hypothetical protein B0H13DRAFT_2345108 [Mycena leptocephala]|nr:hypothetical protein B0H13DRAFT_2345108 [Mycena leptocephala]